MNPSFKKQYKIISKFRNKKLEKFLDKDLLYINLKSSDIWFIVVLTAIIVSAANVSSYRF